LNVNPQLAPRPTPGTRFPDLRIPLLGGGELALAQEPGWRLLIVYRGRHCPLCKTYLSNLDRLAADFEAAGISVAAVSADPEEKAAADRAEFGWRFRLGHGLTVDQIRTLGLYVSNPRSAEETDRPFAEPGLFVINPDGLIQVVDLANVPFARPDLDLVLRGIKIHIERRFPIRGTG
jgi:peroxiredoxin